MSPRANAQFISRPQQDLFLCGARVAIDPWHAVRATLVVRNEKIEALLPGDETPARAARHARVIDIKDHLILPGLVNAHDHLQFGIFPRLGSGPYPSWREWAADIYRPEEAPLRALLDIPKDVRLWWGAIRNALAGVTTVCHHDAFHSLLSSSELPIDAHTSFGWVHSLDDSQWMERYAMTPDDWPFILHCAEGLDARSRREVAKLGRKTRLDSRMVLVHAVGVPSRDWSKLRAAGVWIVWCPTSNLHILGRTLARDLILSYPSIVLGSDSPISAAGDLLDEIQAARSLLDIPPDLLYRMVTTRAAQLLRLEAHAGTIAAGGTADLLIVRDRGRAPCEALVSLPRGDLAAVLHKGAVAVASEEFHTRLDEATQPRLRPIERQGRRWYVRAPAEVLSSHPVPRIWKPDFAPSAELTNQ